MQNRYVGYFAAVKNIYNMNLPPRRILMIKKIIVHSIHGKCFSIIGKLGRKASVLTIRESFPYGYIKQTIPTHSCLFMYPHI